MASRTDVSAVPILALGQHDEFGINRSHRLCWQAVPLFASACFRFLVMLEIMPSSLSHQIEIDLILARLDRGVFLDEADARILGATSPPKVTLFSPV